MNINTLKAREDRLLTKATKAYAKYLEARRHREMAERTVNLKGEIEAIVRRNREENVSFEDRLKQLGADWSPRGGIYGGTMTSLGTQDSMPVIKSSESPLNKYRKR